MPNHRKDVYNDSTMNHLAFLVQTSGVALGLVLISFLIFKLVTEKGSWLLPFALSVSAHIVRTLVFTVSNYSRLSSLGLLPHNFEDSNEAGLIHLSLVLLSAYFLVIGLFRIGTWKKILTFSIAWWAYFSLHLLVIVRLILRLDFSRAVGALLSMESVYYLPFGVAKAVVAATCLVLAFRKAYPGSGRSWFIRFGCLAIALSQVFDMLVRIIEVSRPDFLALFYAFMYAGIALIMLGIRKDSSTPLPESSRASMEEDIAKRFGLSDTERRILEAILAGASNKEIAYNEKVSLSAVKHRIFALYKNLNISSRYELMAQVNKERSEGA